MKIKTIMCADENAKIFDQAVNEAIAEGWILGKREILPGQQYNATNWARRALYAELVMLDPAPEADPVAVADPFTPLQQLRQFCESIPKATCENGECPLSFICTEMAAGKAIDELSIPVADYGKE